MLFNGKYYNKPGHLGMTRQQLLEKLNGGGSGGGEFTILSWVYDEVLDKYYLTYSDGSFVLAKDVDKVFTPFTFFRKSSHSPEFSEISWDLVSITTIIADNTELIDYGTLLINNYFFRRETLDDPNSKIEFYYGD